MTCFGTHLRERAGQIKHMAGIILLAVGIVLGVSVRASAVFVVGPVELSDGDSVVEIDPYSSAGVYKWEFGGKNHLAQQWFWFRTNLDNLYDDKEYSIDEIGGLVIAPQPDPAIATMTYTDPAGLAVEVTYVLGDEAGPTGGSTLVETVMFSNNTNGPMTLNLFQYSDFELGGDALDSKVEILNGNMARQSDTQAAIILSETLVSGGPALSEVDNSGATLAKLTDLDIDEDLDGSTLLDVPGDLTWAFQWQDAVIAPGQALLLSKLKDISISPGIVPEPAGLGLIGLALLSLRRKRR